MLSSIFSRFWWTFSPSLPARNSLVGPCRSGLRVVLVPCSVLVPPALISRGPQQFSPACGWESWKHKGRSGTEWSPLTDDEVLPCANYRTPGRQSALRRQHSTTGPQFCTHHLHSALLLPGIDSHSSWWRYIPEHGSISLCYKPVEGFVSGKVLLHRNCGLNLCTHCSYSKLHGQSPAQILQVKNTVQTYISLVWSPKMHIWVVVFLGHCILPGPKWGPN